MNKVELGRYITKGREHKIFEAPHDSKTLIKRPRWYTVAILDVLSLGHAARTVERDMAVAEQLESKTNGEVKIPATELVTLYHGLSYRFIQTRIHEDSSVEDPRSILVKHGEDRLVRRFDRANENFITEDGAVVLIDFTVNPLSRVTNKLRISDKYVTKMMIARRKLVKNIGEKTKKFRNN